MDSQKTVLDLFSPEMMERMYKYAPPEGLPDREKSISGRLIEEVVELHLDSGGTPTSAMAHLMDAVANEAFKVRKIVKTNQEAYPSNFPSTYNGIGVEEELGDTLFVWLVNMLTNRVTITQVKAVIEMKIAKLEKARSEGKLHITKEGRFYIQKD